ncbi:MAG: lamin tail domain-containing protein, partial [Planctomycetes bacterium]|nr:lamin tail domain-containing protein [Planctomycetota bacterium]
MWETGPSRGAHALIAAVFALLLTCPAGALTINEIMYHHPEGPDLEYIEVYNEQTTPEDLSGFRFARGVRYIFPEG